MKLKNGVPLNPDGSVIYLPARHLWKPEDIEWLDRQMALICETETHVREEMQGLW